MSEEREPDLDHVREAMREHDERQEENEELHREQENEEPAEDERDAPS